jgi:predicted dehydrogenase
VAALQFAGDLYGVVPCTRKSPHAANVIEIQGRLGRLTIHDVVGEGGRRSELRLNDETVEVAEAEQVRPFVAQVEAFNAAIASGQPPSASGADGLRVAEITAGLFRASRTGQTTYLAG